MEVLKKEVQKPIWISNQYSQQLVHKLRSKEHAILVGTNTAIADNPKLNVRSWSGINPMESPATVALQQHVTPHCNGALQQMPL